MLQALISAAAKRGGAARRILLLPSRITGSGTSGASMTLVVMSVTHMAAPASDDSNCSRLRSTTTTAATAPS